MMNLSQALDWLYTQIPNYQNQGLSAYKPGLERIRQFADSLENPQNGFDSIHIAGTNGKGSTAHMLASILQEQGYKVGLFTSPHLKHFNERIKINGEKIPDAFITSFVNQIYTHPAIKEASFFEITTLMAWEYFRQQNVDIAIIETGLGGRLDATNIINPLVSVITSISLDHTHILGDTEEKIAFEKAGIIKENTPLVLGIMAETNYKTIEDIARAKNAAVFYAKDISQSFATDLKGKYQNDNQKTVLQTINVLQNLGINFSEEAIENGFLKVVKNTSLLGRWQTYQEEPKVILDTAHNIAGFKSALEQLHPLGWENVYFVLGFVNDKDVGSILSLLPKEAKYVFTRPSIYRGKSPKEYEAMLSGFQYTLIENVQEALEFALEKAPKNATIFVGGSNFVIADLL